MSWRRADPKDKVVIRDYLVQNYEYLGDGRIRHKGSEKARKAVVGTKYCQTVLRIKGRRHCLFYHQAVWILCHGDYPKGEIDHIDMNRLNNRIENLRDVNGSQNQLNKLLPWNVNPQSHLPGVVRDTGVWGNRIHGKHFHSADKYGLFHLGILLGKTYQADNP